MSRGIGVLRLRCVAVLLLLTLSHLVRGDEHNHFVSLLNATTTLAVYNKSAVNSMKSMKK